MQRFTSKIADTACWLWEGATLKSGYGQIQWNGRVQYAHRVAYKMFFGPIPAELVIDHKCRNRNCVNPLHLEPVTDKTNVLRGVGLTAANSKKTHCPRGHAYDIVIPTGGRWCRTCKRLASKKAYLKRKAKKSTS